MKRLLPGLLLSGRLLASQPAPTQTAPDYFVCYAEAMPQLVVSGRPQSVAAAVQRRLVYPPRAARAHAEGRVFVSFTVTASGLVQDAQVIKGFRPDCDAAALRAVRQLPRFVPVRQGGKPMATRFTLPVSFKLLPTARAAK